MSTEKVQKYAQQLKRFLPDGFEVMVAELLLSYKVKFTVTNPRATKLGDYRPAMKEGELHRISVNGNLNPYSFLVTTLHEFAHLTTFLQYRNKVKPHGEEWKAHFRKLLWPAVESGKLPKPIENALMESMRNMKASSCTDMQLARVLKQYDVNKDELTILEQLPESTIFTIQGKRFKKGKLRRSRFICEEITTKRSYLINALAEVELIEQFG